VSNLNLRQLEDFDAGTPPVSDRALEVPSFTYIPPSDDERVLAKGGFTHTGNGNSDGADVYYGSATGAEINAYLAKIKIEYDLYISAAIYMNWISTNWISIVANMKKVDYKLFNLT